MRDLHGRGAREKGDPIWDREFEGRRKRRHMRIPRQGCALSVSRQRSQSAQIAGGGQGSKSAGPFSPMHSTNGSDERAAPPDCSRRVGLVTLRSPRRALREINILLVCHQPPTPYPYLHGFPPPSLPPGERRVVGLFGKFVGYETVTSTLRNR